MAESAHNKFTCACIEWYRSACQNQPFFMSHEGKDYCVLHYPNTAKVESFRTAFRDKLLGKDFDFQGVWFPSTVDFSRINFDEPTNFSGAIFSADVNFKGVNFITPVDFSNAHFTKFADFSKAHFTKSAVFYKANFCEFADFHDANFQGKASFFDASFNVSVNFANASFGSVADFGLVKFNAAVEFFAARFCADAIFFNANFKAATNFRNTNFSGAASFLNASFNGTAGFSYAHFKDSARFSRSNECKALGESPHIDLQFAQVERPERVSFHTLTLRPHWFINVDSRKFEFANVDWNFRLKDELPSTIEIKTGAPHRLLAITFRQLADNAEVNHRYHEASRFRYNAFEARRIEKFRGFVPWRLDWWYWLASGYGESVGRAFLVFVALLFLFTLGYRYSEFTPSSPTLAPPVTVVANAAPPTAPDLPPKRLGWREAALYSFNVSILQKPEPKPKGLWASFLVSLETILGPAQAALLALAVRRRFMR